MPSNEQLPTFPVFAGENMGTLSAFGRVEGTGLLYLFGPSPDQAADPRDSEYVCSGEVAARTVKAERNVGSSPVCEAVSEVRPPGGGFLRAGIAPGHARHRRPQNRPPRRSLNRMSWRVGLADGMPCSLAILPLSQTCTRRRRTLAT